MSSTQSLPPSFFEALYAANPDPWNFQTSAYEASKYAATLAALPRSRYRAAFEIGGSIGVLTAQLAARCDWLLSIDVCQVAQAQAMQRCAHLPQVQFQLMSVPDQFPTQRFDLILLSEVGYYWCREDLLKAQRLILNQLEPGGHLLLVHWIVDARELPLTGNEVHDAFQAVAGLRSLQQLRTEHYRLDLYERLSERIPEQQ